jgi:imidazole glycerol phosphate synthase subunit HisF
MGELFILTFQETECLQDLILRQQKALVDSLTIPVIASGGVSSIEDIKKLAKNPESLGCYCRKSSVFRDNKIERGY